MVDDATRAFLDHLHRGGAWRHLWWMPERHSRWAEVGAPLTLPGGSREIYYGVHPTTQIPPTNRRGETVPTEHVRSQTPFIAAVSCLFAEFDAKHFDGGKEAAYAHIESLEPAPSAVVDSGGGYHCVPLNTEILTPHGWRRWYQVQPGDMVMGYDRDRQVLDWTVMQGKIVKDSDDLVRVHNGIFEAVCTPDHRWVAHVTEGHQGSRQRRNVMVQAREISRRRHQLVLSAPSVASGSLSISEAEAAVLGWLLTDGSVSGGIARIAQSEKKYTAELRELLRDVPHTERYDHTTTDAPDMVTFHLSAPWYRNLEQRAGLVNGWVWFVANLSQPQRRAFLNAAWLGDGTLNRGGRIIHQNTGEGADALRLAVFLEGYAPLTTRAAGRAVEAIRYGKPTATWDLVAEPAGESAVWCPQTALGTWVMRQGDTICITGNCYWLLDQPHTLDTDAAREAARKTQAAWVTLVGGDPDSKDLCRVLRVPGTTNHKYDPPRPVQWVWLELDTTYAWDDLADMAAPFVEGVGRGPLPAEAGPSTTPVSARVAGIVRYAEEQVKRAGDGTKHHAVYRAAVTLGGVADLSQDDIETTILRALNGRQADTAHTLRTIRDGIIVGRGKPWDLDRDRPGYVAAPRANGHAGAHLNGHAGGGAADVGDDGETLETPARFHRTDLGNARRLVARHGAHVRFIHAWDKWVVWDGGRWAIDETGAIHRLARETVRSIYDELSSIEDPDKRKEFAKWAFGNESRNRLAAMVALAQAEEGVPIRHEALDEDPYLLGCPNGTLDLRTGQLRPADPADLITKQVAVAPSDAADCPQWLAFLQTVLAGDADLIGFVQRAVGMTLTADTREQVLLFMYGSGSNGKSTFIELLMDLLGSYAIKAPTEMLMAKPQGGGIPNDVAQLPGRRLVVTAETEDGRRLNESMVKDLTGDDRMTARFMRGEFFSFKPTHTLWMYGNHKPVIKGTDQGIWRRMRLIPFTVHIPDEQKDKDLKTKLRTELPGILRWALDGCLAWQRDGLGMPAAVSAATESYRQEMDVIGTFIEECCVVSPSARVGATELYAAYTAWCERNGERERSQTAFGRYLSDHSFPAASRGDGRKERTGLGLKASDGVPTPPSGPRRSDVEPPPDSSPDGLTVSDSLPIFPHGKNACGDYMESPSELSIPSDQLSETRSITPANDAAPDLTRGLWSDYDRRMVEAALAAAKAGKPDKAQQWRGRVRSVVARDWIDSQLAQLDGEARDG